jgi:hypothetical protein
MLFPARYRTFLIFYVQWLRQIGQGYAEHTWLGWFCGTAAKPTQPCSFVVVRRQAQRVLQSEAPDVAVALLRQRHA